MPASWAATNAVVLNGAITSTVQVTQRDGFVRYSGGGTGYTSLAVTGTALLGATNGIATSAGVNVGVSNFATLDLNGFNQTIASLTLGNFNANSPITGSLALGASTLNLNGDLSIVSTGTGNAVNTITASNSGGTVNFGASPRNLSVADNSAPDDIVISTATIAGAGVTKTGTGTLALNGATVSAPLTVSTGTLQIGTATSVGSATIGSVNFASGTTLRMKAGASNDALTVSDAGGFVNAGTTNLIVNQLGGILANGTYPLINYTGASPGTGTFNLIVGHAAATLSDTAGVISLSVTGNDRVIWDGTNSTAWSTGATGNWKLQSSPITPADFIESDDVIF